MNKKLLKLSLVCVTGALIFTANPKITYAYEEPIAGFVHDKGPTGSSADGSTNSLSLSDIPIPGFKNIGIADVDTNLLIRSGAGEDFKVIGKLPKNAGCDITEDAGNGWTKISAETSTGTLIGYVKSEFLITGSKATEKAREVGNYVATANTNGLNVRTEPSTDASKVDVIAKGEELIVLDSKVITEDKDNAVWVQVTLDSDEDENGTIGYVSKDYVDLSFQLAHALSIQEIQYGAGVSDKRINLVNFAKDHLGEAYVWGGTRLGVGVDCSGFVQQLYKKVGIYITRTSRSQAYDGAKISASELKPGDLVFYGSSSYISHVAMYIGNGQIIHASNRRDGIKISNMNYRTPVRYVRVISD